MEILGYIYIIQSLCYNKRLKIGSTKNIHRRKWDYHTYVPDEVYYNSYFCIIDYGKFRDYKDPLKAIETTIHKHSWFKYRRGDQKKEFFVWDNSIEDYVRNIEYLLDVHGVVFKPIYKDEIYNRPVREKYEYLKEGEINNEISKDYILRDYQEECIEIMKKEKIGKFILPTGSGKTVIFLSYLQGVGGTNLVLVPFIELINQTYEKAKCFGFDKIIRICNGKREYWGDKRGKNVLYISTYQSSNKQVYDLCNVNFNNIIYDETHYTVLSGENENSMFQYVLKNGKGEKKFFFTATEKNIKVKMRKNVNIEDDENEEIESENNKGEISMDNTDIYGEVLYSMSIDQAIKKDIICDYNINIWLHRKNNKEDTVRKIIEKKIGNRILIFCSSINKVKHVAEYLDANIYREKCADYYINYADSKMSEKERREILNEFKECKGVSILVLCGLFKVGFDCPCIDTIIHYDKCTSTIDLIQKNGRCLRKYKGKIKSTIILLTNIDNHDTDIVHYKKMLNSMGSYDARIKGKLIGLKEKKDKGIYSTIKIIYDYEDINLYTIYDKYMNYISGYSNILKNLSKIIEYKLKKGKWPTFKMKYQDMNVGQYWIYLKGNFLMQIKRGIPPKLYIMEKDKIIFLLQQSNLWEEALNEIDLEKLEKLELSRNIPPIERMKKTIEYRIEYNQWPSSKQEYQDIKIGQFWHCLKKNFFKPIKLNQELKRYKTEKNEIIFLLRQSNLWENALNEIDLEKLKNITRHITPIERMKKTIEYRIEYDQWPSQKIKYKDIKIGQFWNTLKTVFLKPIKTYQKLDRYIKEKDEMIFLLQQSNLWEDALNSVK